jgi:hypothetical protein
VTDDERMEARLTRIAAYIDGELPPAERSTFEAEMAADPALAAEVARWRGNDTALQSAFGSADAIDDALLARLGLNEAKVVSLDAARAARAAATASAAGPARRWPWPAAGALAAGLAVLLVFGNPQTPQVPQGPDSSLLFQAALQDLPSAATASLDGGATVSPRLSFVAGDGRFCREFALAGPRGPQAGIACRTGSRWQVEALVSAATPGQNPGLTTAAGADTAALDAAYKRLQASDPLNADAESQAISARWEKSAK